MVKRIEKKTKIKENETNETFSSASRLANRIIQVRLEKKGGINNSDLTEQFVFTCLGFKIFVNFERIVTTSSCVMCTLFMNCNCLCFFSLSYIEIILLTGRESDTG